ncbi:calcitonin receptor-like [Cherax quadricarinatus]|uniref:calcitonin receptor-like n=1 Tax=Cherax quadricarinatus TaxID=27406 RepID=UPI00387E246A
MLTASWPPGSCPNTWDGWQCWPATLSDTEIKRPCPSYIYHGKGPSCAKEASKRCQNAGHWYRREGKQEWSNYSSCSVEENIHRRLYVHIAAYSISVAALFPALCIFISYKQLRVHRITLHKHLFLSLLLEALGVIIFRLLQLYKNDVIQQIPVDFSLPAGLTKVLAGFSEETLQTLSLVVSSFKKRIGRSVTLREDSVV